AGTDASLTNRRDWQFHAERINAAWGKQVESIIETGKYLIEAHDEMDRHSFEAMVQQKLIVSPSTARKLIVTARNPILANCAHWHKLPPSWGTLYELAKLPIGDLRARFADGSISPKLERKDVANWRQSERGKIEVGGKTIERERRPTLAEQLKTAEAKLARQNDGSLFDLKNDSVRAIAEAIVANISEAKAASLAKAIHEA